MQTLFPEHCESCVHCTHLPEAEQKVPPTHCKSVVQFPKAGTQVPEVAGDGNFGSTMLPMTGEDMVQASLKKQSACVKQALCVHTPFTQPELPAQSASEKHLLLQFPSEQGGLSCSFSGQGERILSQ